MYIITDECVGCGNCINVCPNKAIKEGEPYIITTKCINCGKCVNICPVDAIIQTEPK